MHFHIDVYLRKDIHIYIDIYNIFRYRSHNLINKEMHIHIDMYLRIGIHIDIDIDNICRYRSHHCKQRHTYVKRA